MKESHRDERSDSDEKYANYFWKREESYTTKRDKYLVAGTILFAISILTLIIFGGVSDESEEENGEDEQVSVLEGFFLVTFCSSCSLSILIFLFVGSEMYHKLNNEKEKVTPVYQIPNSSISKKHDSRDSQLSTTYEFGEETPHFSQTASLDSLIAAESRENVREALIQTKQTLGSLDSSINQLTGKKNEMESTLSNQKSLNEIHQTIEKYRQRLQKAKSINSMGTAKTYAFMITKQKKKQDMMRNIGTAAERLSAKLSVLKDLKEDLIETAYELPKEADLMGSMSIVSAAMGEVHNVDAIMNELTGIEEEIKGLAVETELATQESSVDIDSLPADVRAEIEREMGA